MTVTMAAFLGMFAGALASIIESIGDYYACARMCQIPPPPVHAVNRGIGIEGLGCVLAGVLGSGNGSTTYGESVAIIGLTKVSDYNVTESGGSICIYITGLVNVSLCKISSDMLNENNQLIGNH